MPTGSRPSIHQLEYFVAIAEEQQFTRAAERLHVAQPSISAQIGRLERLLGASLFHRGRSPVTLTDAGRELLPLARRVLQDLAEVNEGIGELEALRRGRVAVGATPSLAVAFLPAALASFHRRYPDVRLSVLEGASRQLLEQLEAGVLDLALGAMPLALPTLERVVLATEEFVVVARTDHPLASRRAVTVADLADVPMIMFREGYDVRASTLSAFATAGFAPTVALEGGEMGSVLSMVRAGLGIAIVPSIVAEHGTGLQVLRLESPRLEREISLVRPRDRASSRAAAALSDEITGLIDRRGHSVVDPLGLQLVTARPGRARRGTRQGGGGPTTVAPRRRARG